LGPQPAEGNHARRARWVSIVIAVFAVIVVLAGLWFAFAGRLLVREDSPTRADAVVVLSGDPLGDRLRAGGRVFAETASGRFVMFLEGGDSVYDPRDDAYRFLRRVGIDDDDVRGLPSQTSTAEEAAVFAAYARECEWRKVTVVTSPYHTARAGWLFRRALGDDVEVITVASDDPYDAGEWWNDPSSRESTLLEWVKVVASVPYVFSAPEADAPTGLVC
jgi:uncharacterized SAM-binding protein YcdF (DUF218 family)